MSKALYYTMGASMMSTDLFFCFITPMLCICIFAVIVFLFF